ncbi:MAG: cation:proton antiporter [Candidatus Woesearchaeota archaeon]
MQEALLIITSISVLLFVGVLCSWIGKKLRVPDVLLLLIAGMLLAQLTYHGQPVVQVPITFLNGLAILALAMVSFDSTTQLRLRELDTFSAKAFKLTICVVVFLAVFFTTIAQFLLGLSIYSSLLLATIMIGTAPEITLGLITKTRPKTLLRLESIFNTPFTVILPFLVIKLMQSVPSMALSSLFEQLVPFLLNIIVGLGAGIFVGVILFKLVQHAYTEVYSPLAVIIAALLAYVLAENLGGAGVLAASTLGLFLGNVYVKEKFKLLTAESVLTKALYVLVFVLTGVIIDIPYTFEFFITSGLLFAAYLAIRFAAVSLGTWGDNYSTSEKMFMTLSAPKGLASVAVVFVLAVYDLSEIATVIDMTLTFILYSIVLATITTFAARSHENRTRGH